MLVTIAENHPYSLTDPNYLQSQGSNLDIFTETKTKGCPKSPYAKRILVVDDDPDITLIFKVGLDGHYYDDGEKKKRLKHTHIMILY